jgi:large subunit ribosomal protein L29
MKVDELRVLEVDDLDVRLKAARRELYELRFKHAVGQLENSSQISKVRHDIARIMMVLRERDFGIVAQAAPDIEPVAVAVPVVAPADTDDVKPKRGRGKAKAKAEEGS